MISVLEQQQMAMTNVVTIDNNEEINPISYSQPYPPTYSVVYETSTDKPPSYEQTIDQIRSVNNPTANAVILSVNPTLTNPSVRNAT